MTPTKQGLNGQGHCHEKAQLGSKAKKLIGAHEDTEGSQIHGNGSEGDSQDDDYASTAGKEEKRIASTKSILKQRLPDSTYP